MITMLNKLTVRPGQRDALVKVIEPVMRDVAREPGTLVFLVFDDTRDPDVAWVQEVFADEEAMRAHSGNPNQGAILGAVRDLLAGPMESHRLAPVLGAVRDFAVTSAGTNS